MPCPISDNKGFKRNRKKVHTELDAIVPKTIIDYRWCPE